jgi:hypothetical protein
MAKLIASLTVVLALAGGLAVSGCASPDQYVDGGGD